MQVYLTINLMTEKHPRKKCPEYPKAHILRENRPNIQNRNPTTSFLTATTLIYAIGAGITAAAGTRLALQLILVKGFKLYSFQFARLKEPEHCYLLSLPPCIRDG